MPDTGVHYTTRELFERIDERLIRVDEKLDTKANLTDLARLEERVVALERLRERAVGFAVALALASAGSGAGLAHLLAG